MSCYFAGNCYICSENLLNHLYALGVCRWFFVVCGCCGTGVV